MLDFIMTKEKEKCVDADVTVYSFFDSHRI